MKPPGQPSKVITHLKGLSMKKHKKSSPMFGSKFRSPRITFRLVRCNLAINLSWLAASTSNVIYV